jgi:hypothetical protein
MDRVDIVLNLPEELVEQAKSAGLHLSPPFSSIWQLSPANAAKFSSRSR